MVKYFINNFNSDYIWKLQYSPVLNLFWLVYFFSISIKTVINNLKLWLEYGLHFRHMVYFYIKYDIGRIFHVLEAIN